MKLDRNITTPRRGKYALIKLRESTITPDEVEDAIKHEHPVDVDAKAIDFGDTEGSDFFVIRLKDKYAEAALTAYARAASPDDLEYADEIFALAKLASNHPIKQKPN